MHLAVFALLLALATSSSRGVAASIELSDGSVLSCWDNGSAVQVDCWPWLDLAWAEVPTTTATARQSGTMRAAWQPIFDASRLGTATSGAEEGANGDEDGEIEIAEVPDPVDPVITHTNIHICPSALGVAACNPPLNHPLRQDSATLQGSLGDRFSASMDLQPGTWLVMAHVRVQEREEARRVYKYDITLIRELTVDGGGESVEEEEAAEEKSVAETVFLVSLVSISAIGMGAVTVYYALQMRGRRKKWFIAKHGVEEYLTQWNLWRVAIDCIVVIGFALWASLLIQSAVESYEHPDLVAQTRLVAELTMPTVLICPFSPGGSVQLVDVSFYPSLFGFVRFADVEYATSVTVSALDVADGTSVERECALINTGSQRKSAISTFSAVVTTALVVDADGNPDNALISATDEVETADDVTGELLTRSRFLSRNRATTLAVQAEETYRLDGSVRNTFSTDLTSVENVYTPKVDEKEIVLLVQAATMSVNIIREVWGLSWTTLLALVIGASTGARLLRAATVQVFTSFYARHIVRKLDREEVELVGKADNKALNRVAMGRRRGGSRLAYLHGSRVTAVSDDLPTRGRAPSSPTLKHTLQREDSDPDAIARRIAEIESGSLMLNDNVSVSSDNSELNVPTLNA